MPPDPNVVIVFGTLLAALVVSLIYAFWYQTFKHKHKSVRAKEIKSADKSIGVSELEEIVRRATSEATELLDARIAGLEEEVRSLNHALGADQRQALPEHGERNALRSRG